MSNDGYVHEHVANAADAAHEALAKQEKLYTETGRTLALDEKRVMGSMQSERILLDERRILYETAQIRIEDAQRELTAARERKTFAPQLASITVLGAKAKIPKAIEECHHDFKVERDINAINLVSTILRRPIARHELQPFLPTVEKLESQRNLARAEKSPKIWRQAVRDFVAEVYRIDTREGESKARSKDAAFITLVSQNFDAYQVVDRQIALADRAIDEKEVREAIATAVEDREAGLTAVQASQIIEHSVEAHGSEDLKKSWHAYREWMDERSNERERKFVDVGDFDAPPIEFRTTERDARSIIQKNGGALEGNRVKIGDVDHEIKFAPDGKIIIIDPNAPGARRVSGTPEDLPAILRQVLIDQEFSRAFRMLSKDAAISPTAVMDRDLSFMTAKLFEGQAGWNGFSLSPNQRFILINLARVLAPENHGGDSTRAMQEKVVKLKTVLADGSRAVSVRELLLRERREPTESSELNWNSFQKAIES